MANATFAYGVTQADTIVPNRVDLPGMGMVAIDLTGALTPAAVRLESGIILFSLTAITPADLGALFKRMAQRYGRAHDGAGGAGADGTSAAALALTVLTSGWTAPA